MAFGKNLMQLATAPARIGIAVAETSLDVANGALNVAKATVGEARTGTRPGPSSFAAMFGIDEAVERANRLARLMDDDQPLGRALAPNGPLDRLLQPGGV